MPAPYFVRARAGAFAIRSVRWNGVDYTNNPIDFSTGDSAGALEVSLERGGRLVGQVTDGTGRPSASPMVVVFSPNTADWSSFGFSSPKLVRVLPNSIGRYVAAGLPAGDYLVVAVEADDSLVGSWQSPEFLRRLVGQASKARLSWGQELALDLKIAVPGK
jgi:hypothetical protein